MTSILFIVRDSLPPKRVDVSVLFGKQLADSGISTHLVGQAEAMGDEITWPGGKVYCRGKAHGSMAALLTPMFDLLGSLKFLATERIDFVQVRDKVVSGLFAGLLAAIARKPFLYWMSFPMVEGYEIRAREIWKSRGIVIWLANIARAYFSGLLFYRFVLPRADHIFVQSTAMRDWLAKKGFAPSKMTAVPMGIDSTIFQRDRITPAMRPEFSGKRVILYSGQLSRSRNSAFLLDLLESLLPIKPDAFLVLAGDAVSPDERAWLRAEIDQRNLNSNVLLTGWLPQTQILQYLVAAEVGLSPIPRGELFDVSSPTKLVEYLAVGLPSVANDIPDQKLVIDSSGAGLCVPMEIVAFRDAVLQILDQEEFRRNCALAGPRYAHAERSYEEIAKRVAAQYHRLVARQL